MKRIKEVLQMHIKDLDKQVECFRNREKLRLKRLKKELSQLKEKIEEKEKEIKEKEKEIKEMEVKK